MDNYMSRTNKHNKHDIIKHNSSILLCARKWENMLLDLNLNLNPPFEAAFCARKWENMLLDLKFKLKLNLNPPFEAAFCARVARKLLYAEPTFIWPHLRDSPNL